MTREFLEDLVSKMDQYGQLEHDSSFEIVRRNDDGSVDVLVVLEADESDPKYQFVVVLAVAGEFKGHAMVEIRKDPAMLVTAILINAVPRMIVAVLLEL